MKKAFLIFALVALFLNSQMAFAQTAAPSPDETVAPSPDETVAPSPDETVAPSPDETVAPAVPEGAEFYDTEVITRPDGTVEVIRKYRVFEQIRIPAEIFERKNLGYDKPILDSNFIKSPSEISSDPEVIGLNAFLSILIFLLVGLACFLFNNVLESHGDGINKFTKRIPLLNLFNEENKNKYWFAKKIVLLLFLLVFGLVAAHISPDFDLFAQKNLGMLIITIGTIVIAAYAKDIIRFIIARRNEWEAYFKPNVMGLFLAIGCVALSRNLNIPPGYLFGIPIGLFIISKHFEKKEGKFEFASLSWMFLMALAAWFITPYTKDYQVVHDLFNLLYIILLEGLFFELFPLTFLPGEAIFKWSKIAWAFLFGSVSFLLLHSLFNPSSTFATISDSQPTINTIIILTIFVIVCFTIWGGAKLRKQLKKIK